MPAVPTLLLAATAFAGIAAQGVAYGPGMGADWAQPTIPHLRDAEYLTRDILYGRHNGSSGNWTNLRLGSSADHDADEVAVAEVLRNSDAEGWDVIKVRSLDTRDEFYTAGYAEGLATYESICNNWYNVLAVEEAALDEDTLKFFDQQVEHTRNLPPTTAFNRQALGILRQIDGLYDGWKDQNKAEGSPSFVQNVTWRSIFLLSNFEEMPDLSQQPTNATRRSHCHAALRISGKELLIGHGAQDSYVAMLRQWKTYVFSEGRNVTFSSYPGFVHSSDDFIVNGHGLFMMSTTLLNFNSESESLIRTNLPGFIQYMASLYLAATPRQYADMWARDNSGSLQMQIMLLDTRVVDAALHAERSLPADSFVLCENAPPITVCRDMAGVLEQQGFWLSFDVAYFNETREATWSTIPQVQNKTAGAVAWPSSMSPPLTRTVDFASNVTTMFYVIRHDNYPRDPMLTIALCSQSNTTWARLACPDDPAVYTSPLMSFGVRMDVVPYVPGIPLPHALQPRAFGSLDAKVTSARMLGDAGGPSFIVQNGPTTVQQPPFSIKAFYKKNPQVKKGRYLGMRDVFDYAPMLVQPFSIPRQQQSGGGAGSTAMAGVAIAATAVCVAAAVGGFVLVRQRRAQRRMLPAHEATGLL